MQVFIPSNQKTHLCLLKAKDRLVAKVRSGVAPAWLDQDIATLFLIHLNFNTHLFLVHYSVCLYAFYSICSHTQNVPSVKIFFPVYMHAFLSNVWGASAKKNIASVTSMQ